MKIPYRDANHCSRNVLVRAARVVTLAAVLLSPPSKPAAAQANGIRVWVNSGEDKVTRDDLRVSRDGKNVVNAVWDGTAVHISGARNEIVNFAAIIEALNGASSVSVALSSLTGPGGFSISSTPASGDGVFNFVGRNIELFLLRYLQIKGLSRVSYDSYDERHVPKRLQRPWTGAGAATGGWVDRPDHDKWYPDIAVPLELVNTFSIAAASNQTIWVDVYVPPSTPAGVYQGNLTVSESGVVTHTIPVQLQVYDFALPDTPTAKTMVYFSSSNINQRYVGNAYPSPPTPEGQRARRIRDQHAKIAHRHRLSLIGDDPNDCGTSADQPCAEWQARLDGTLFTATNGYAGPGIGVGNNVYSIGTYGSWSWRTGTQTDMHAHTDAWANWFAQHSPTTDTFLYLIDESPNTGQIETWSQWIRNNPGPGREIRSMATIALPTAASQTPSLDIPASTIWLGDPAQWQPPANQYTADPRKRFYVYNSHRPASGTSATEDDGVALREVAWVQYKMHLNRWFLWESTYYNDYQGGRGNINVFQNAQTFGATSSFDSVFGQTGWNYANGDGVLFYPGTDTVFPEDSYGVNGPFASTRLKFWRRGLQDVEYLALAATRNPDAVQSLVNQMVPKALWEYGVSDPNDPTWVRTDISWSTNPDAWEDAREQLAAIITGDSGSPTVTLTSPATGSTVTGAVTLAASASAASGIAGVQFLVDDNPVGLEDTTSPYAISYDTTALTNGSHTFTARARNALNATTTSAPAMVTVSNVPQSPGQLTLTTALSLSPAAPVVNQAVSGSFTVKNTGGQAISVQYVFIGARDPANGHVDFPVSAPLTLQPGQQFTYQGSRTFTTSGNYTAWGAYYDGTNWFELGPHTNFSVSAGGKFRIEQNDARVVQGPDQWHWNTGTNSQDSGGSHITTATNGSTLQLQFTGTGINILGITDSCSGQASVAIDGIARTFDAYRASGGGYQQVLHAVTGLTSTTHNLTLTVLGTKQAGSCGAWIYIDAFEVVTAPGSRVEDSSSQIARGPDPWRWNTGTSSQDSGGSHITTATNGSTLQLQFTGTGINVLGITDSCSGQASVAIDGVARTFDAYRASGGGHQQVLHAATGLTATTHNLTLTVLGTKQASSCGAWIYIDAFEVQP